MKEACVPINCEMGRSTISQYSYPGCSTGHEALCMKCRSRRMILNQDLPFVNPIISKMKLLFVHHTEHILNSLKRPREISDEATRFFMLLQVKYSGIQNTAFSSFIVTFILGQNASSEEQKDKFSPRGLRSTAGPP